MRHLIRYRVHVATSLLSLAVAACALWLAAPKPPTGTEDRVPLAVQRLRARLVYPDSLKVLSAKQTGETVEIEFEARASVGHGFGRSRFWLVRGRDGVPENRDGGRDDPFGLFKR